MAAQEFLTKRGAINKANARMVAIVAVAAFISIFCLVASKAVFSQTQYQSRVTKEKQIARNQLQENLKAFDDLKASYQAFDSAAINVINGNSKGSGDNDGPNSKIILDALPSTYDFPALVSSVEKILASQGVSVSNIAGTDDQVNQQGNETSPNPEAVEVPFSFTVNNSDFTAMSKVISVMQKSIRPMHIDQITLTGGGSNMTMIVKAHTYYQPGKSVDVSTKVVK